MSIDLNKTISTIVVEGFRPVAEKLRETLTSNSEALKAATARIAVLEARINKITRHLTGALEGVQSTAPVLPKKRKPRARTAAPATSTIVTTPTPAPVAQQVTKTFFEHPKKAREVKAAPKPRRTIKVARANQDPVDVDNRADQLGILALPNEQKH